MRIAAKELRDCVMYSDLQGKVGSVNLQCGYECRTCGFYEPVIKERASRIRRGEWSWDDERGVRYLRIGKVESEGDGIVSEAEAPV